MKRSLKIAAVLAVGLLLGVAAVVAVTFMGRLPIPDAVDLGGIRVIKDGIVTVGLIPISEGEVALVDAGNDARGTAILAELSRQNLGPAAVTTILLTHGHPDHMAAVGLFPNAQVATLEDEVSLIEGRVASRGPLPRWFAARPTGITVTKPLKDGDVLAVGPHHVRVFAVPGHTQGSAAYLVDDVLFLGDSGDAASDKSLIGSAWLFSDSQRQNRASLVALDGRLTRETVNAIVFSHSGPLKDGIVPLDRFAELNR